MREELVEKVKELQARVKWPKQLNQEFEKLDEDLWSLGSNEAISRLHKRLLTVEHLDLVFLKMNEIDNRGFSEDIFRFAKTVAKIADESQKSVAALKTRIDELESKLNIQQEKAKEASPVESIEVAKPTRLASAGLESTLKRY